MSDSAPGPVAAPAEGVDRAAAFAAPPAGVPRKVIFWAIAAVVVLGGGGTLLERVFSGAGLNAYSATASSGSTKSTKRPTAAAAGSLRDFMSLAPASGTAPPFTLTDQGGAPFSLASLRGRVVVLAFFDARCDDICPVLGAELAKAESALGAAAGRVAIVAVNTDPEALSVADASRTTARLGFAADPRWHLLTGPLGALDLVWTRYGVTVEMSTSTRRVAHTELLYFIDATGRERFTATPFANESRTGVTSLGRASIDRFGLGIATYARRLLS